MWITKIYIQYHIPVNLQQHMLRVAALAKLILDSWKGQKIDGQAVITCAMLHDIAKPITFNIEKQRQFVSSEEEFNQVKQLITNMKNKYGADEHLAAVKIFQEIGCNKESIRLINNLEWIYLPRLLKEKDVPSLLINYCDMRIGTKGILPIQARFADLKLRAPFPGFDEIATLSHELEMFVQSQTTLDVNAVTDEQINSVIRDLFQ